jgi:hypothetical protein
VFSLIYISIPLSIETLLDKWALYSSAAWLERCAAPESQGNILDSCQRSLVTFLAAAPGQVKKCIKITPDVSVYKSFYRVGCPKNPDICFDIAYLFFFKLQEGYIPPTCIKTQIVLDYSKARCTRGKFYLISLIGNFLMTKPKWRL